MTTHIERGGVATLRYANSGVAAPVDTRGEQKRRSGYEAHDAASHAKAIVETTTDSLSIVMPV